MNQKQIGSINNPYEIEPHLNGSIFIYKNNSVFQLNQTIDDILENKLTQLPESIFVLKLVFEKKKSILVGEKSTKVLAIDSVNK